MGKTKWIILSVVAAVLLGVLIVDAVKVMWEKNHVDLPDTPTSEATGNTEEQPSDTNGATDDPTDGATNAPVDDATRAPTGQDTQPPTEGEIDSALPDVDVSGTNPPATNPPATNPPATEPPATEPPAAETPTEAPTDAPTEPPATEDENGDFSFDFGDL